MKRQSNPGQASMFTYVDGRAYPKEPGFQKRDTSHQAAKSVQPKSKGLKARVLEVLKKKELTADEVAEYLGLSILSIRPRVAELSNQDLIEDTGRRRLNSSQKNAIVWRIK